ncbi:hypothetical protein [Halovenus salina]|uniref:Uncharacterized protein n=2 Tax=Halovenus salina TaxID=1510225 RepID=A0ABD5W3Y9_9EURY
MDDLPDTQIRVSKAAPDDRSSRIESHDFGQALDIPFDQLDIVAVVLRLDEPELAYLAASVCRSLEDDQTVFAVPAIPENGLSEASTVAFTALVDAAGTTVPYDLGRIRDSFADAFSDESQQEVLDTTGSVMIDWVEDVFEALRDPLTVPLNCADAHALLQDGGVSLLYRGWGCRDNLPDVLLQDAAAHRVCDGNRSSADGGFGFLRFGEPFTLREFEAVEQHAESVFRPEGVDSEQWLMSGQSSLALGDNCWLAFLLTGIDAKSLPFLQDRCAK